MPIFSLDLPGPDWLIQMQRDQVVWLHGSNSTSLEGVARFRALLSMEKIDCTPWFFRNGSGLLSGERLFTIRGLANREPVSRGISLLGLHRYYEVLSYTKHGTSEDGSVYPVIYGLKHVKLHPWDEWHSLSEESINIDHILAIYVPVEKETEARSALLEFGNEALSRRVRALIGL